LKDALAKFAQMLDDPYGRLRKWKAETGKKIIGCLPMYVPEEIIHAAGMLPIIVAKSEEPVTKVDQFLPVYTCRQVRGTFDLALRDKMDFIDGFVFADICEPVQVVADTWYIYRPSFFHHNIIVPMSTASPRAKQNLINEYEHMRESLQKTFDCLISDGAIKDSIAIYNKNRALMKKVNDFRRDNPGSIGFKDMVSVAAAGMLMPKEDHNKLLEGLLAGFKATEKSANGKPRLIFAGCFCDRPDSGLLKLIEELDATVVDDDLYTGNRYYAVPVDENLPAMEALAERYVKGVGCPTKINPANMWADRLLQMAQDSKADAVIILNLKYCEPIAHDYPNIRRKLAEAGIAETVIELDEDTALGQIRTRLQALVEMVGERQDV